MFEKKMHQRNCHQWQEHIYGAYRKSSPVEVFKVVDGVEVLIRTEPVVSFESDFARRKRFYTAKWAKNAVGAFLRGTIKGGESTVSTVHTPEYIGH